MQKRFKIIGWCFALVALHVCAACGSFAAELAWPEVTQETKPWTRWWWLGNICTDAGLQAAMEQYAAAGLGGLEITPLYGVRGEEEKFIPYLSLEWVDRLEFVLKEGKRLGLGIDMNNGTGWPFGGPWVTPEDTCKYLAYKKFTVRAGEKLAEPVVMIEKGMVSPRSVSLSQIKEPFGKTLDLQKLAIDNLKMPGPLKLNTLMAFSDQAGEPLNLTDKVANDGTLNWMAPADGGAWTLYAVFDGLHSRMVKRAAPGGEGHAPDHFSAAAIQHYLAKFDEAFKEQKLDGLRAFFCDSYEVDEATPGEANFTPKFFDEFQRRRGYDLRLHLPELLGSEQSDEKTRLLCDWRETISDLLLDNFTNTWRQWAAAYGKIVRYQAHGSPGNVLDLYAAADIPETEGYGRPTDAAAELKEQVAMMYASSAAHVTGKQLASSETCTWLDDHFLTTLGHAKHRIDTHFLAGINHVVYHGTTYSPPEEGWPGFLFYAAVEFCPANPWWDDFAALNQYVTRCQSFLQTGQPDNDVLVYAPFYDRWMQRGNGKMPHFVIGGSFPGQDVGQELVKTGYCFDFISDQLLQNVAYLGGKLHKGGNRYQAIVLPETNYVPLATMEKLIGLANDGAAIVVQKSLPGDVPGFGDLDVRRTQFKSVMAALRQSSNEHEENGVVQISVGEGRFLIGKHLPELLSLGRVRQEKLREKGIEFVRRREAQGPVYFLVNRCADFFDGWAPLAVKMPKPSAALLDPQNGHIGNAAVRGDDLK
ncbi:MAG TPA: glycosyl hydrolase, partial [Pirellulales bacterium]